MSENYVVPISQAAKLLGVSIQTLRRWHKSNKLPASYVSPGGHRYYRKKDLEQYTHNLFALARQWASASVGQMPLPEFSCPTSSIFQARLSSFETRLRKSPVGQAGTFSLIVAIAGEIGNNSFDHNLGNWPDVPGVFFAYDLNKRQVVLADRGLGVLTTLRRVKPTLRTDQEALRVAFTEILSGRSPEKRGNGLKFVRLVVSENKIDLEFQSGSAVLTMHGKSLELNIAEADTRLPGTLAHIQY